MQAIALEIGFSETTFVTESGGDRYAMRIFTLGLSCRSPATRRSGRRSHGERGRVTSPATQVVAAGEILVEVDLGTGFAWMTQLLAEFDRRSRIGN